MTCPLYAVETDAQWGTLTINQDGTFTYDYDDATYGDTKSTDTFTYSINGGTPALVTIKIWANVPKAITFEVNHDATQLSLQGEGYNVAGVDYVCS